MRGRPWWNRTVLYAMALACGVGPAPLAAQEPAWRVLVFSKTAGYRHDSIAAGIASLQALGDAHGFAVDASEDAAVFHADTLGQYATVVWLNTTGDVLDATQQAAYADYVANGGGYVGIHAAADTEYDWPFYGELLAGAWFHSHPAIQSAHLLRADDTHAAALAWPAQSMFTDEWYNFRANPRSNVQVLLRLDETSYDPGTGAMGDDHPIAWLRSVGQGRAFYTGLGHRSETFADPAFRAHLLEGIVWSARRDGDIVFADGFEAASQGRLLAVD